MKKKGLFLDYVNNTDFLLIGINTSTEMYKLVYLINKKLDIRLRRAEYDLDFHYTSSVAFFQWYEYYSSQLQSNIYLVTNKSFSKEQQLQASVSLFADEEKEVYKQRYLFPELKNVDYLIKLEETSLDEVNYKRLIFDLNSIKQISTAYQIENHKLKNPENLTFY